MSPPTPSEQTPSGEPGSSAKSADVLCGRRAVLCVTGGIAAYKSAYLVRALVKAGAEVVVVMSEAAQRFVAPLTFETLSGNRVVTSTFERVFDMGAVEHIEERLRLYTKDDLLMMFDSVGLATEAVYGDYRGNDFADGVSDRVIVVTRKRESR